MIIFVGDKPSSKNLHPDIPFVGTASYDKLLTWVGKLDIHVEDIKLTNKPKTIDEKQSIFNLQFSLHNHFIALGREAEKTLKSIG